MNIGTALLVVDITSVVMSFFVFGPTTGLYSSLGLMAKSLVIDGVIENINLCKCFNIICDNPDPICDFIIEDLNRSATIYKAQGAFFPSQQDRYYDDHETQSGRAPAQLHQESGADRIYPDLKLQ